MGDKLNWFELLPLYLLLRLHMTRIRSRHHGGKAKRKRTLWTPLVKMDIHAWGLWGILLRKWRNMFKYASGWEKSNHQLTPQLLPSPHLLFSFLSSLKFITLPPLKCTTSQSWNNHLELLSATKAITSKDLLHLTKPAHKLFIMAIKLGNFKAGQLQVDQGQFFIQPPKWKHDECSVRVPCGFVFVFGLWVVFRVMEALAKRVA